MSIKNGPAIMPFLTVKNCKKAIEFYVAALGATIVSQYDIPGNKLSSKLVIDNAVFCVGDEEPEFGNLSPDFERHNPVRIVLETVDADKIYEKALEMGATQICPMTTEEEWRIGKFRDPFGHIWEIGYPLQNLNA